MMIGLLSFIIKIYGIDWQPYSPESPCPGYLLRAPGWQSVECFAQSITGPCPGDIAHRGRLWGDLCNSRYVWRPELPDAGEVWGEVVEKSGEWLELARAAM